MDSALLLLSCFICLYALFVVIPVLAISGRKNERR